MASRVPRLEVLEDREDVSSRALAAFIRGADPSRSDRELVAYACCCVRSALADFYRERGRFRLAGGVGSSGADGSSAEVAVFLSSLPQDMGDVARLLLSGHTLRDVMELTGLSYRRVVGLRDELRSRLSDWL